VGSDAVVALKLNHLAQTEVAMVTLQSFQRTIHFRKILTYKIVVVVVVVVSSWSQRSCHDAGDLAWRFETGD
jgi:hypothetical protein